MDNYTIHPDWRLILDHASLTIIISIVKEYVNTKKHTIINDSNKEHAFIKDLTAALRNINTSNITDTACLERIINKFASFIENT